MFPGQFLSNSSPRSEFGRRVQQTRPGAQRAERLSTLTLNVGLRCNLECKLCHHRCSPARSECMSREVMLDALQFASDMGPGLLDITGGEPVLWPFLREFVTLGRGIPDRMRIRTNLDALLLAECAGVAQHLAENRVEILASLPEALEGRTIGGCLDALSRLAALGYGDPAAGAIPLDIAYNPMPGQMPRDERELAEEFRAALAPHGVAFRSLYAIVNAPLGGLADLLEESGESESYATTLRAAFDADALADLYCRHGVEIAWDGSIWDCDYNLAARVPIAEGSRNIGEYVGSPVGQMALTSRRITFSDHCFACTARCGIGPG